MDSIIPLFAVDSFAAFRDLGRASGVCREWRSFIRILPAAQRFLQKVAVHFNCQDDAWPFVDGSAHPREMFASSTSNLVRALLQGKYQCSHQICLIEFFAAWDVVIRSLASDTINEIQQDGSSLLSFMLSFESEFTLATTLFERLILNFIQRTDLNRKVLTSTPTKIDFPGFSIETAPVMWLCMRGKKPYRGARSVASGYMGVLEKLPHDILVPCFMSSPTLKHGDNILQYILEPVDRHHATDKDISEASLCQVVAQRMGLIVHLHRNCEGVCALSYAEQFVCNTGLFWHDGAWARVRDIINERMLDGCHDLSRRTDEESFMFLTYVVQELRGALESALSYVYEELNEQSFLRHVVASFESAEARRADDIRMHWLARGWRFAYCGRGRQIREVLQHYESVRIKQDIQNLCSSFEGSLGVQDMHNTTSYISHVDQIAMGGVETVSEETQEADYGQAGDPVIEHVVHDEPAAIPHANDAGYRAARQQLIVDEEWAQGRQRQINKPSIDVTDQPTEVILEQDAIHLHILEFSRTPKDFHHVLEQDEDLSACTAALRLEGFVHLGGAKIFVSPMEYRAAVPHALGLQSRHVVASERYVEIVLAAVRRLKGKNKVHEKCEKRRDIVVGSQVEVTGLVNKKELNGHSGIVLRYVESRSRWAVRIIADEREVLVLPKNLRLGDNELLVKNTFIHIPTRSVASVSIGARTY